MFDILEVALDASGETDRPRLEFIATITAAIAYGFIICLFLHTFSLLIMSKEHIYTGTTRWTLIIYIVVMFVLSTLTAIQQFSDAIPIVSSPPFHILKMNELFFLPLAIFGADGFMLWRCVILYQNASLRHRVFLYGLLTFISMGSLGSAILYYLGPQTSIFSLKSPFTPSIVTISITTSLNFMLTAIIAGRLLYHQETMRRVLGKEYRSPYLRVIVMLVESCSLIVVTGLVFLILVRVGNMKRYNGCAIAYYLLPHICVLSPLLIVFQVARGRAAIKTSVRLSQMATPNMRESVSYLQPMQFIRPTTSAFDQDSIITIPEVAELDRNKLEKLDGGQLPEIYDKTSSTSIV